MLNALVCSPELIIQLISRSDIFVFKWDGRLVVAAIAGHSNPTCEMLVF